MVSHRRTVPPWSLARRLAIVLEMTFGGAVLGAVGFLAILHDDLGMPRPPGPPAAADAAWATMFDLGFAVFGAAVGGLLGLTIGVVVLIADWWQRRAA